MLTVEVTQPLGYRIEEITEKMDIVEAGKMLSTRKQRRYTSAVRYDDQVEIKRHIWLCPYCGGHTPAYPKYFSYAVDNQPVSKEDIRTWATLQMSLFESPRTPVYFNKPINKSNYELTCPRCKRASKPSGKTRTAVYSKDKYYLTVSTEIADISEIFSLKWMSNSWLRVSFPVYEKVVFNFRKGTTSLALYDASGIILTVSDITQKPESWSNGALFDILSANRVNQRTLRKLFAECYGSPLPFPSQELTLAKYVLLTRFIGYSRAFYTAIPFNENSGRIDGSFKNAAKKLHRAEQVPHFYEESMLPKAKSIRRVFFKNPGLLFYTDECLKLWEMVEDVNHYRSLITCDAIYNILSQIHLYPGVLEYYGDFICVKGIRAGIYNLEMRFEETSFDAVAYSSMSKLSKKAEQRKWRAEKARITPIGLDEDGEDEDDCEYEDECEADRIVALPQPMRYSIPMHIVTDIIKPCEIRGYYFSWLYSSNDYLAVGRMLKNCLTSWKAKQNPVVAIYKDAMAVGAIEVDLQRHCIVQAHTRLNGSMSDDEQLDKAFKKWMLRYGFDSLEWS